MQFNYYTKAAAITKHDTTNIPEGVTDAVYVGGAGDVVAVFQDDSVVTLTCLAATLLPIRIKRVNSTSTSATAMVALYQV